MTKKKVGVLGATGSVGQKFILLLENHPNFKLAVLGASSGSKDKKYKDVCRWKQSSPLPLKAGEIIVSECKPENFKDCVVVFSGIDADFAGDIESAFVNFGLVIISNARNFRRDPSIPLVVPIVNSHHLNCIDANLKATKKQNIKQGFQICISNCSTAGLVVPLKALVDAFGPIDKIIVTTMQALSGAGFSPGVSSMDIIDNLIPYISGEEEKIEWETKKILGTISQDGLTIINIPDSEIKISAACNRVAVIDGHTECVSFSFKNSKPPIEMVKEALINYKSEPQILGCFSAPQRAINYVEEPNRPQPRLDRNVDNGYGVTVGRLRPDPVLDYKFVVLSHNTVHGASGSGILIAETLLAKKLV